MPRDRQRERPDGFGEVRAAELTGELPAFVADAIRREPVDEFSEEDRETIEALRDFGVSDEEAKEAVREGRVPLVLLSEIFEEKRTLSIERLSEKAGVPVDVIRQVRAALGLPPQELYGRTDLRWAKLMARLLRVMPVESVIRSARGRGQAASSTAMSDLATIRDELILPLRQSGADDLTVAVALAEAAKELIPLASETLVINYRLMLEHLLSSQMAAMAASSDEQELTLAVGFADVVGYTALSARIDPQGLDDVLDAFEDRVVAVVSSRPEVAIVKYLGDAVMLVASSAAELADALLDLVTPTEELADAPLRAGMASGPVRVREGDYFGSPVNMAARLTDLARSWSLLADEGLLERLGVTYEVKRILPTVIRGFGLSRPIVVRRPVAE